MNNYQAEYFLIFANKEGKTIILGKPNLTELYDLITTYKMIEGTYSIIKGAKVV